jgi:hypothetical protein
MHFVSDHLGARALYLKPNKTVINVDVFAVGTSGFIVFYQDHTARSSAPFSGRRGPSLPLNCPQYLLEPQSSVGVAHQMRGAMAIQNSLGSFGGVIGS